METGNALLVNAREALGIELIPLDGAAGIRVLMGYDRGNDLMWFIQATNNTPEMPFSYHFFRYDVNSKTFIAQKTIDGPYFAIRNNNHSFIRDMDIYGDEIWYYGYRFPGMYANVKDLGIDKRHIDNPTEILSYIDIEHLGTLSIPQGIIYDKPYIWVMVERKGRIQMLKLLPK
jgi:hypothetical protein